MVERNFRCIMNPAIARFLIKQGYVVRDIKPNKKYLRETIFVFDNTEEIAKVIDRFKNNKN